MRIRPAPARAALAALVAALGLAGAAAAEPRTITFDEAVARFGRLLMRMTSGWGGRRP